MKIQRFFTKEGIDPYNTVTWETRDSKIIKPDGTVIFEQTDIQSPDFWSQQSINIVANKYFFGKLNTSERENSIAQIIERVSKTITTTGKQNGYFETPEDSSTFYEELKHILLYQKAAFNSPVWFNCGTINNTIGQSSACFINSIEDSIESITEFVKTEGLLFKYGSGSGVNISPLRSKLESVSGGGHSSGPVAFMKLHDANASTIKSGGRTRRSAKMVIINDTHPDIIDFITSKGSEEKKAKILMDNGYAQEEASDSVYFQNANHSVRISNRFMNAVLRDEEWETVTVTTNEVAETHKAKDILHLIAEETHSCGDPGIQFDDIINVWHTCPNDGPQVATNPCVTGDTLITTKKGLIQIKELCQNTTRPDIKSFDDEYHHPSQVICTGIKPVYKLTTHKGYSVTLTADHKVYTLNRGDVPACELTKDDTIQLVKGSFGSDDCTTDLALLIGLGIGDGCISQGIFTLTMGHNEEHIVNQATAILNDLKPSKKTSTRHTDTGYRCSTSTTNIITLISIYAVLDQGSIHKRFTPAVYNLNKDCQKNLLKGLFTADGTVANYSDKSQYVALDSTSLTLLEQTQRLLLNFGIVSKIYKNRRAGKNTALLPDGKGGLKEYHVEEMHSLRISRSSRKLFEEKIGFAHNSTKNDQLRILNSTVSTYKDKLVDNVESLEYVTEQKVYDITEPETSHFIANGIAVHNCSEYLFLDDTSCNLSSINLLQFYDDTIEGCFDIDAFMHTIQIMFIAQDILIDNSTYPTEKIRAKTLQYRTIGLGYTNLGAYLMISGVPYDSDEARIITRDITSLLTAKAYQTSADLADEFGTFPRFDNNNQYMLGIIEKHRDEYLTQVVDAKSKLQHTATQTWTDAVTSSHHHGVRNAQVTVLAPTGTISFLMDCDTTGVEPELSLIKYKSLSGGGQLKIVNNSVQRALYNLKYSYEDTDSILKHIEQHNSVAGSILLEKHIPIFDCSLESGGRIIDYHAHLDMLAAIQPFISGSISKTINVPNTITVEEILDLYIEAWKKQLKCVAIYRDGSKSWQPLNTTNKETNTDEIIDQNTTLPTRPIRLRLPTTRNAINHKFTIGGHEGYVTVGLYDNNAPGELFIVMNKEGSIISGLMDGFATSISMALQYGVPLSKLCEKFEHTRFEPSGFTGNPSIPMAKSILDYIFRWLRQNFLPAEETIVNGTLSNTIETSNVQTETSDVQYNKSDAPACSTCGNIMIRQGTCYYCQECGSTSGCS